MVKAVCSVGLGVVVAALAAGFIAATPIGCNPVTNTGINAPLTKCSPAYGGFWDKTCAASIDVPDSDQCTAAVAGVANPDGTRNLRPMEDDSNSDVSDLETYLGESLELNFKILKEQYHSAAAPRIPWPGSYWPTYQDSINVIWETGEPSASEKYAIAYGLDPTDFMNKVSADNGIDSRSSGTACTTDADCAPLNDGSVCAIRKNATSGYCIPTWYGLCHAWSPAALREPEPKCAVVKNNQTFHVMDIKALLTDVYDGAAIKTVFTGARFNGPDLPVVTDAYGRYTSASRRDLGAGFFHLAITNILGKHNQSFILDVISGSQVWNQPVRSYNVQTMELIDANQASQQYFNTTPYPFNSEIVYLAYVKTTVSWIIEAYADGPLVSSKKVDSYTVSDDYEYLLELDANYAIIGGEWVEGSKSDHPDFLWFPTAKPDASTVTGTGLSYANVLELLELSLSCGASANSSESGSASASASTRDSGASASASNSSSASTSTSTSVSDTTSASNASGGISTSDPPSASGSRVSASHSTSDTSTGSTSPRSTGSNNNGNGASSSTALPGSGTHDFISLVAQSASGNGSTTSQSTASSGSTETTNDTTETQSSSSSKGSTGSTEADTSASLPAGSGNLILTPSTGPDQQSASATNAPTGIGYYTPPPIKPGQDLADVIDNIDTTAPSSPTSQEASTDAPSTTAPAPVHRSC